MIFDMDIIIMNQRQPHREMIKYILIKRFMESKENETKIWLSLLCSAFLC